jgi:hypothetical protein
VCGTIGSWVGVLLDVEVALNRVLRVAEKRPLRADGVAELVDVELVVLRDYADARSRRAGVPDQPIHTIFLSA